jgi:hypothetical protein
MVKRVFWVALGATVGVLVVTRGSKALKKFTPAAVADTATGALSRFGPGALTAVVRGFANEVRGAATEREFELYQALGADVPDTD